MITGNLVGKYTDSHLWCKSVCRLLHLHKADYSCKGSGNENIKRSKLWNYEQTLSVIFLHCASSLTLTLSLVIIYRNHFAELSIPFINCNLKHETHNSSFSSFKFTDLDVILIKYYVRLATYPSKFLNLSVFNSSQEGFPSSVTIVLLYRHPLKNETDNNTL